MRERILTAVLAIAGAVVGFWYGPVLVMETAAADSWEERPAVVERVSVELDSSGGSGSARETDYEVVVEYRYEVDGESYTGDRYQVAQDLQASTAQEAERLAQEYRDQPEIRVFVDPQNPRASVMEQGGAFYAWMTCVFGWAMLVSAIYVYYSRIRAQRGS